MVVKQKRKCLVCGENDKWIKAGVKFLKEFPYRRHRIKCKNCENIVNLEHYESRRKKQIKNFNFLKRPCKHCERRTLVFGRYYFNQAKPKRMAVYKCLTCLKESTIRNPMYKLWKKIEPKTIRLIIKLSQTRNLNQSKRDTRKDKRYYSQKAIMIKINSLKYHQTICKSSVKRVIKRYNKLYPERIGKEFIKRPSSLDYLRGEEKHEKRSL